MTVVGHAGSVADSIARAAELTPDLVLIDFRLTDGTGADAATGIRQVRPETKLIFLTREDSDAARFAALEAGASAFIHKSRAAQDVVDAIRTVAGGGSLFTPRGIAQLLNNRREVEAQLERLTAREKEVLRLMAEGMATANSSPPTRAQTSEARTTRSSCCATSLSAVSPALWPRRSLIRFRLSRSIIISDRRRLWRSASATSRS